MSTDPDRTQSEQTDHDDSGAPAHAAPEGAERHPLIDLSRDPHRASPTTPSRTRTDRRGSAATARG
ncbi:hypothetical protein ACFQ0O_15055 [Saccharopolyspora spinosporotrichia]